MVWTQCCPFASRGYNCVQQAHSHSSCLRKPLNADSAAFADTPAAYYNFVAQKVNLLQT